MNIIHRVERIEEQLDCFEPMLITKMEQQRLLTKSNQNLHISALATEIVLATHHPILDEV